MPCALDGNGQLTLMSSAGAGGAAGQDLAALRSVAAQLGSVLVVHMLDFVDAEAAYLFPLAGTSLIVHHDEILLSLSNGKESR